MGVGGCNIPTLGNIPVYINLYYIVVDQINQIKMNLPIYWLENSEGPL